MNLKEHRKFLGRVYTQWVNTIDLVIAFVTLVAVILEVVAWIFDIPLFERYAELLDASLILISCIFLASAYRAFFSVYQEVAKQYSEVETQVKDFRVNFGNTPPVFREEETLHVREKIVVNLSITFHVINFSQSPTYVDLSIDSLDSDWDVLDLEDTEFQWVSQYGGKEVSNRLQIKGAESEDRRMEFGLVFEGPSDPSDFSYLNLSKMNMEIGADAPGCDKYTIPLDFTEKLRQQALRAIETSIHQLILGKNQGHRSSMRIEDVQEITEVYKRYWGKLPSERSQ